MQFKVKNHHHGLRPFSREKVIKLKQFEKETMFQAKNRALSSRPTSFGPTVEAPLALWSATVAGTDNYVYE